MSTVLLLSGGLDSTTLLYHLRENGETIIPIAFDYGQPHRCELDAAKAIASDVEILVFPRLRSHDPDIPNGHYNDERMKILVYPNRNMVMLALAVGIAVDRQADAVAYAAHAGDHTIYPDCRPEFFQTMQEATRLGNWHQVRLVAPFIGLTKTDIVRRGYGLGVPFVLTWSCYRGDKYHCGTCGTCIERREAFTCAGVNDPTEYAEK